MFGLFISSNTNALKIVIIAAPTCQKKKYMCLEPDILKRIMKMSYCISFPRWLDLN